MNDLLQDLRDLHVLLVHPRDRIADELLQQVHRIGCSYDHMWPLQKTLPGKFDVVFLDVTDQSASELSAFLSSRDLPPTVIALVAYENPSVLQLLFDIGAHAMLVKPLRAAGVLGSIVMGRRYWAEQCRFKKDLGKLRDRLENVQKVNEAKFILMRHRGIDERAAYDLVRKQAMAKRITTTEIAQSIINAASILSNLGDE